MAPVSGRAGGVAAGLDLDFWVKTMREQLQAEKVQIWGCSTLFEFYASHPEGADCRDAVRRREEAIEKGVAERVLTSMGTHGTAEMQASACAALWALLRSCQACRDWLVKLHGIEAAIRSLSGYLRSSSVQMWACAVLSEFVRDGDYGVARAVELGAAHLVLRAMRSHVDERDLQACGCNVVGRLAIVDCGRGALVAEDPLPCILAAMRAHVDSAQVQSAACAALVNVISDDDTMHSQASALQCANAVLDALRAHPESAEVNTQGCAGVRSLANAGTDARDTLASATCVRVLLAVIRSNFALARVQSLAVASLACLSCDSGDRLAAFIEDDGVALVTRALQQHPSSDMLQECGFPLLRSVGLQSTDALTKLVEAQGVECVVEALKMHPSLRNVQTFSCALIHDLSSSDRECQRKFGSFEVVPCILRAIRTYSDDAAMQECGIAALQALAYYDENISNCIVGLGGFDTVLKSMQLHIQHPGIVMQGYLALRHASSSIRNQNDASLRETSIEVLVDSLATHKFDPLMQQFGLTALRELVSESAGQAAGQRVVDTIRAAFQQHGTHAQVCVVSCEIAEILSQFAKYVRCLLVSSGCVEMVLASMSLHEGESSIQAGGCGTIFHLLAPCVLEEKGRREACSRCEDIEHLLAQFDGNAADARMEAVIRKLGSVSTNVMLKVVSRRGVRLLLKVATAHLTSLDVQTKVLSVLQRLVVQSAAVRSRLAAVGVHAVLQSLRVYPAQASIQEHGCGIIAVMACGAGKVRDEIMDADALPLVLLAMQVHAESARVQAQGCAALQNMLCGDLGKTRSAAKSGGPELVLNAMGAHVGDPYFQAIACIVLHTFGSVCAERIAASGGVEAVVRVMRDVPDSPEAQEHGLALLSALSRTSVDPVFFRANREFVVQAIIDAIAAHMTARVEPHCGVLASIAAAEGEDCRVRVNPPETIELLLNVTRAVLAESRVQAVCCKILADLQRGASGIDQTKRIAEMGGTATLVASIEAHPSCESVQKSGITALRKVVCELEDQQHQFFSSGGLLVLLHALAAFPSNDAVVEHGLGILHSTMDHDKNDLETISSPEGLKSIIVAVQRNLGRVRVQESGCAILSHLAWWSRQAQDLICKFNGFDTALRTINAHMREPNLLALALGFAQSLLCGHQEMKHNLTIENLELMCNVLKKHPDEQVVQAMGLAALQSACSDHENNIRTLEELSGGGLASSAVILHAGCPKVVEFGSLLLKSLQPWRK